MQVLRKVVQPLERTFPQCAFGSGVQKFTTIWTTSASMAATFDGHVCSHTKHEDVAHGKKADGTFKSADAAAYPSRMNRAIASAIATDSAAAREVRPALDLHAAYLTATAVNRGTSTTSVDGVHPISAVADPVDGVLKPSNANCTDVQWEHLRTMTKDKQRRRRHPVAFSAASVSLRARAAAEAARLMHANAPSTSSPTLASLYDDAADIADQPLTEYVSDSAIDADARVTVLTSVVLPSNLCGLDGASEVYVVDTAAEPAAEHPAMMAMKSTRAMVDRKTVVYFTTDGVAKVIEPKGIKEALESLQSDQWKIAIQKEMDNLSSHSAFHYSPVKEVLARGKKIMRMTWVFKVKVNDDGTLNKYKARFCVVGTGQTQGDDYWESYASGARYSSVKTILCLVACLDWVDFHFDLDGAYLTADIDAEVHVDQPPGVDHEVGPNGEKLCMTLDKAIYGTVQAGRLFTQKFRAALLDVGFTQSLDDESVYRLDHKLGRVMLAMHVDDGIGGATTEAVRDWMYAQILERGFKFSQKGSWDTVLGFGVSRDKVNRSVTLVARKQIDDLVREHLTHEVAKNLNPTTPSDASIMHLQPPAVETPEEAAANAEWRSRARSLKGALIHIAHVHPAIAMATSRVCAFMATPTVASFAAAKRILAWLAARRDVGVTYGNRRIMSYADLRRPAADIMPMNQERDYSLWACTDSDLPSGAMLPRTEDSPPPNIASHRAQLGYVIMLGAGCIEAVSRRQHSTAVDIAAAELYAASTCAAVLLLVANVLEFVSFGELGREPVRVWCDNEAAVLVSKDATSRSEPL